MRVLLGGCKQEVATFNPALTGFEDFTHLRGEEVAGYNRGRPTELGGMAGVLDGAGVEIVGGYAAMMLVSGGTLAADAWHRIRDEFLAAVRTAVAAGPLDGVAFAMHGAMCATDEPDPEGALLAETRRIVGERIPIVVSVDLHGIMTDRMLEAADIVVPYHTYPHNDFRETGERAATILLRLMRGEVDPVVAYVRVPALVRGDELITATGKIRRQVELAQRIEVTPPGLVAGMFWGNPFTDVPQLCSMAMVVTDGNPDRAAMWAEEMAEGFWEERAAMQAPLVSIGDAIRIAAETPGTTVLVDAADATSSGASGDSNAILRGLLEEQGYPGRALVPIVDAPAVREAFRVGVGGTVRTTLGGTLDPGRFPPLSVDGRVRMLGDGRFTNESHGTEWFGGDTAVLEIGRHTVIVTSRAVSLYDRSLFLAYGQDPQRFDLVVQKSPHCQHHMFEAWATRLVGVDAPGSTSANLPSLGHTVCARPMYPMERDTQFEPEVRVIRRGTVGRDG